MQNLQNNLSNHWNRYLVMILMIALVILKNRKVISPEEVTEIQYALTLFGFFPTNPKTFVRSSRRVLPLLALLFLFQCKPKPENVADKARAQVQTQIQKTNEKIVAAVDSLPADAVISLVTNDSETVELFRKLYRAHD